MSRLLILIAGLAALVGFLFWMFPGVRLGEDNWLQMTSLVLIALYLLVGLNRKDISTSFAFKSIMIWIGIALVVMVGYSYRGQFSDVGSRLAQGLNPSSGYSQAPGELSFQMSAGGHHFVDAMVNGVPIRFMVDTGASRVVLTAEDAQRLGYDLQALTYNVLSSTANGDVWSAAVRLDEIRIQNLTANNIRASVSQSDLDVSLLGQSFLENLKGYKVEDGVLTFLY